MRTKERESIWDLNELKPFVTNVVGSTHDLTTLKIHGYVQGNHIRKTTDLHWKHFEWVQHVNQSQCAITGKTFYTFIGWKSERPTILIVEKK